MGFGLPAAIGAQFAKPGRVVIDIDGDGWKDMVLGRCGTTEIYINQDSDSDASVATWLCRFHQLNPTSLEPHCYTYKESDAVRHMLRVAAGLDSMVLGEPQILGQMKDSYQSAVESGSIDTLVSRLFQHTFSVAKQIRTDTAIGASPVSVAFAAVIASRSCSKVGDPA